MLCPGELQAPFISQALRIDSANIFHIGGKESGSEPATEKSQGFTRSRVHNLFS